MHRKRVLLLATLLMLVMLPAVTSVEIVRTREQVRRSRAKGFLTQVHFIVRQAAELTGQVPETIRKVASAETPISHSWRAMVLWPQALRVDGIELYRRDEDWSSPANRRYAERVIEMNGNYFAGGDSQDVLQTVDDCAHILAVNEPGGASGALMSHCVLTSS